MTGHPVFCALCAGLMLFGLLAYSVPADCRIEFDASEEDPEVLEAVRVLLRSMGEDVNRAGLEDTPIRVARMLQEFSSGLRTSEEEIINGAIFDDPGQELIVLRDIEFSSLCEHHLLPFTGTCTVAYLPQGKVVGLSKIARIVDHCARRPQLQERLTRDIGDFLMRHLNPLGVAVQVQGQHQCMAIRGVQKSGATMVTRSFKGLLKEDKDQRQECLALFST